MASQRSSTLLLTIFCWFFIAELTLAQNGINHHLLVGYWGQNAAGPSFGTANFENELTDFCKDSKYDIINLAFVVTIFHPQNKDQLPDLNFAFHCRTPVNQEHPRLLRCPIIEQGIRECQARGKKVAISLGGATGNGLLASKDRAETLANNLWQLFLGGTGMGFDALRPFGTAVLDGVDLDIEGGSKAHWAEFARELRRLMDTDDSKHYIISGAPQCPFPDAFLGPSSGSALGDAGELFDYLYIQFYNNFCSPVDRNSFDTTLDKWLTFANDRQPKGPRILLGLPAHERASGQTRYYIPPAQLSTLYRSIRNKPGVGGIMLWELSFDQNNVINNRRYSEHAFDLLPRNPAVSNTAAPTEPATASTTATTTTTAATTTPTTTAATTAATTTAAPTTATAETTAATTATAATTTPTAETTATMTSTAATTTPTAEITVATTTTAATTMVTAETTAATTTASKTLATTATAETTTTTDSVTEGRTTEQLTTTSNPTRAEQTTTTRQTTTEVPATQGALECPSNGIQPHPSDPTRYIQCANGAVVSILSCPSGLFFNKVHKICFQDSSRCEGVSDGLHPYPPDPRKFISCTHGLQYLLLCTSGLVFDPELRVCNWPKTET